MGSRRGLRPMRVGFVRLALLQNFLGFVRFLYCCKISLLGARLPLGRSQTGRNRHSTQFGHPGLGGQFGHSGSHAGACDLGHNSRSRARHAGARLEGMPRFGPVSHAKRLTRVAGVSAHPARIRPATGVTVARLWGANAIGAGLRPRPAGMRERVTGAREHGPARARVCTIGPARAGARGMADSPFMS